MIERWLVAVRDHPNRPPLTQCHVLTMLALRMNWASGTGYASVRQLGADAAVSEPTVRRATRWGRDTGYLLRTRRGHRVSTDRIIASEWRLTQPLTGDLLEKPTDQNGRPNRSAGPTQPLTTDPPSRTVSSISVTSARGPGADAPRARPSTGDRALAEAEELIAQLRANPRSEACKAGDHPSCVWTWCTCTCTHRGRQP